MNQHIHVPSIDTLDRMKKKAEINEIRSRTFSNCCEGIAKITPLIKWVVRAFITIIILICI